MKPNFSILCMSVTAIYFLELQSLKISLKYLMWFNRCNGKAATS